MVHAAVALAVGKEVNGLGKVFQPHVDAPELERDVLAVQQRVVARVHLCGEQGMESRFGISLMSMLY